MERTTTQFDKDAVVRSAREAADEARRRAAVPAWRQIAGSMLDTFGALLLIALPFYLLYHIVMDGLWLWSLI